MFLEMELLLMLAALPQMRMQTELLESSHAARQSHFEGYLFLLEIPG